MSNDTEVRSRVTLILTLFNRNSIVQVSDRLLTAAGTGESVDPIASKTVVYRATNALVVIGYSGQAAIGQWPVDEWVGYSLAGRALPASRFPGMHQRSDDLWVDLGSALRRLTGSLSAEIAAGRIDPNLATAFCVAGWQNAGHNRRTRRVHLLIDYDSALHRYRLQDVLPRHEHRFVGVAATPAGYVTADDVETLKGWLSSAESVRDCEDTLVRLVRVKAAIHRTIGTHCMSVVLDRNRPRVISARYLPDPSVRNPPSVFVPAIVFPGWVMSQLLVGGFPYVDLGEFRIEFASNAPSDDITLGVIGAARPMTRPRR